MAERFLTPEQIGELLQVSPDTIMRLLRDGKLRGSKVRNQWRVRESDLEKYLEETSNTQEEESDR